MTSASPTPPVRKLLIANRGEIACRVMRTARQMGIATVAVHSDADAHARHVREADEAVHIGESPAPKSYLDAERVLAAAERTGADALHPGYGFLSENAPFARAVQERGLTWVGPAPEHIEMFGSKGRAREVLAQAGLPTGAGTGTLEGLAAVRRAADELGYPVMVKACAGGGGMGMLVAGGPEDIAAQFPRLEASAARSYGDATFVVERYLAAAKHIELQVLGLPDGTVRVLGDRECSVQRRNQKVVEEAPAPTLTPHRRTWLYQVTAAALQGLGYRNAGTVEFLMAPDGGVSFLEVNTRLQVEHTITEACTGLDLVRLQLEVAAGVSPALPDVPAARGHAIQLRVCAEDPSTFRPSPGTLERWVEPDGEGVRVDSGVAQGDVVSPYYDSLLAKLVCWGEDRAEALERARDAVSRFEIAGITTNLPLLANVLRHEAFVTGQYDTGLVTEISRHALA